MRCIDDAVAEEMRPAPAFLGQWGTSVGHSASRLQAMSSAQAQRAAPRLPKEGGGAHLGRTYSSRSVKMHGLDSFFAATGHLVVDIWVFSLCGRLKLAQERVRNDSGSTVFIHNNAGRFGRACF